MAADGQPSTSMSESRQNEALHQSSVPVWLMKKKTSKVQRHTAPKIHKEASTLLARNGEKKVSNFTSTSTTGTNWTGKTDIEGGAEREIGQGEQNTQPGGSSRVRPSDSWRYPFQDDSSDRFSISNLQTATLDRYAQQGHVPLTRTLPLLECPSLASHECLGILFEEALAEGKPIAEKLKTLNRSTSSSSTGLKGASINSRSRSKEEEGQVSEVDGGFGQAESYFLNCQSMQTIFTHRRAEERMKQRNDLLDLLRQSQTRGTSARWSTNFSAEAEGADKGSLEREQGSPSNSEFFEGRHQSQLSTELPTKIVEAPVGTWRPAQMRPLENQYKEGWILRAKTIAMKDLLNLQKGRAGSTKEKAESKVVPRSVRCLGSGFRVLSHEAQ